MPKWKQNTRKMEAKEREQEKKEAVKQEKLRQEENAFWADDDKKALKKKMREEEKRLKEQEKLEKKKEMKELLEKDMAAMEVKKKKQPEKVGRKGKKRKINVDPSVFLMPNQQTIAPPHEQPKTTKQEETDYVDEIVDNEFVKKPTQGFDNTSQPQKEEPMDLHPERRVKKAFRKFVEDNTESFKEQYPSLRRQQLTHQMWKVFQKSKDNPMNKANNFDWSKKYIKNK